MARLFICSKCVVKFKCFLSQNSLTPWFYAIFEKVFNFYYKKKGESIIMTHQEIGIYEINRISYLGKGYMYWVDTCLFLSIE